MRKPRKKANQGTTWRKSREEKMLFWVRNSEGKFGKVVRGFFLAK